MPTLDIANGYCNPVLAALEDILCIQNGWDIYNLGFLTAVTSPLNTNGFDPILKYNAQGTPIEYSYRFWKNDACNDDYVPGTPGEGICVGGDGYATPDYVDVDVGTDYLLRKKWTYTAAEFNEYCFQNLAETRAREMEKHIRGMLIQANKHFLDVAIAAAGGWYDFATKVVSAAGAVVSYDVIGPNSQPSAKSFNDFGRDMRYNGCGTKIVVHGDGPLTDFARHINASIYCCNDQGIDNSQLVRLLGATNNFIDNTGGEAGTFDTTDGLIFEPGAIRLRNGYVNRGDNVVNFDHHFKRTFEGPMGIIFDWELLWVECDSRWVEQVELRLELFTKPTNVNDCQLDGTNGIFNAEFLSCADDTCPAV